MEIKCSCCDATSDIEAAVDGGEWIPYFWDERTLSEAGPTCPECVTRLAIVLDPSGEYYCACEEEV